MTQGYTHGTQRCTLCHAVGRTTTIHQETWRLVHTPAYWGDSSPDTLVLGFSMGANQEVAYRTQPFDQVAFAGLRPRLRQVLDALGIRRGEQTLDAAMTSHSRGLGFTSLSRCSLGLWNGQKQTFETSGKLMKLAPHDPWAGEVLQRCASTYLLAMPASVRRVVLLGTGDDYVRGTRQLLRRLFGDFADINEMAFHAGGRTWVFAVHPSKPNRVQDWLESGSDTKAGRKRLLAQTAIDSSYAEQDASKLPSKIGTRRVIKRMVA